jgi:hypothetical protein
MTAPVDRDLPWFAARSTPHPVTGCWVWNNRLSKYGYAEFRAWADGRRREHLAHRAVLALKLGRPLAPGEVTRHVCHNRACVNPDHLLPGSAKDNAQDSVRARRHIHGERHPRAKLTAALVGEIRACTGSQRDIARRYGVSQAAVSKIRARLAWR